MKDDSDITEKSTLTEYEAVVVLKVAVEDNVTGSSDQEIEDKNALKAKDVVDEFCPIKEYKEDISTNKTKVNDLYHISGEYKNPKFKPWKKLDPEREVKILWEENDEKDIF